MLILVRCNGEQEKNEKNREGNTNGILKILIDSKCLVGGFLSADDVKIRLKILETCK